MVALEVAKARDAMQPRIIGTISDRHMRDPSAGCYNPGHTDTPHDEKTPYQRRSDRHSWDVFGSRTRYARGAAPGAG